jgi:hypothetical protein
MILYPQWSGLQRFRVRISDGRARLLRLWPCKNESFVSTTQTKREIPSRLDLVSSCIV